MMLSWFKKIHLVIALGINLLLSLAYLLMNWLFSNLSKILLIGAAKYTLVWLILDFIYLSAFALYFFTILACLDLGTQKLIPRNSALSVVSLVILVFSSDSSSFSSWFKKPEILDLRDFACSISPINPTTQSSAYLT